MANMRLMLFIASAWLMSGLAPVSAQEPAPQKAAPQIPAPAAAPAKVEPKPYKPVRFALPAAFADAGFVAFRNELAKVARGRVFADLAKLVVRRGFFWDRDFDGGLDPKLSAAENLARAVRLESDGGTGWNTLAAFAAEASAAHAVARPGVICSPAKPKFSEPDFFRLLDLTGTGDLDWHYTRTKITAVRAAPDAASVVVDAVGLYFIRVLAKDAGMPDNPTWARVVTPAGRTGFMERISLTGLEPGQLCYRKDVTSRWYIAGYVGPGKP